MRTHPIVEYYQALRDSAPCLSRAATLPKGTKLGLGKRRAPGNTIILSQPYRRRVSTDRLNREGSQLAASLEGEPGPTPAGKTLPHSFPETSRFRRERAESRAYVFGREMVCSQKSVRNRNFFENAGHVSFSFRQPGSAETHTKPCKTSPQGTSIKRPAIYWYHAVSWGGGGLG